MKRDLTFTVTPADAGKRLDDWLLARLDGYLAGQAGEAGRDGVPPSPAPAQASGQHRPPVSKSKIRRLVMAGAVSLAGRPLRLPNHPLSAGQRINVAFDRDLFLAEKDAGDISFELAASNVVFEDEWLIAVNKPAGLPTEATIVASRDHLQAAVVRFLAARDGMPEPYVAIHHRLDRETSGVILFSKRKEANHGLHAAFERHTARKTYLALCRRPARLPPAEFAVDNRLGRISPKSQAAKWGAVRTGGDAARTAFTLRQAGRQGLLVEARPTTGRTHQIRVHLAGLGLPLWGDPLYGGPGHVAGTAIPRVMLHAVRLELPHPVTGEPLAVEAPMPEDFTACLALLDRIAGPARTH